MFLIYMWVKKCMKMCVKLFKMLKSVFELTYQTPLKNLSSLQLKFQKFLSKKKNSKSYSVSVEHIKRKKWNLKLKASLFFSLSQNKKERDNYTWSTCGLPLIWFAYPWYKFSHFTHLWFSPLLCHNPPLPHRYSNTYYVKNKSPNRSKYSHSNLKHEEHEEHTQILKLELAH